MQSIRGKDPWSMQKWITAFDLQTVSNNFYKCKCSIIFYALMDKTGLRQFVETELYNTDRTVILTNSIIENSREEQTIGTLRECEALDPLMYITDCVKS